MSYLPCGRLFLASLILGLCVLGVLVGCALDTASAPTPTPAPPTPTPLPRGGNLTIRLAADVPELRPWQPRSRGEEQIIGLLYNGLVRLGGDLSPQPDLAERWDAAPDGRTITFTLRPQIDWHDSTPMTADDAVYTLNTLRTISPTTALLEDLHRITSITAPTSSTVVVALNERYAPIFSVLTTPILPRHLFANKDLAGLNFWDTPIGTGPFKLTERKAGASITLVANEGFYRGPPLLDRVAFLVAPDMRITTDALHDGRLLLAELPWSASQTLTRTVKGIQTGFYPENGYYFLGFNTREGRLFADVRLRQALALSIDLPKLVASATNGQGLMIANGAAPGSWADLTPISSSVDLERARGLLDEAGWREPEGGGMRQQDGKTLAAQIFVRGDDPRRVKAAELIARAGQTIGISLTVEPGDFSSLITSKYAPPYDFDLLLGSWSNGAGDPSFADYAFYDPDDFGLFHSSQINQGVADTRTALNFTGFRDPAYDNQAAAAHQLYDLEQRKQAIRQTQARLDEIKPYLFLWADRIPVALTKRMTTLDGPINLNSPMYLWNVERWYLNP